MAKNVLITGANRGIGLGLAETYLAKGYRVFAAARNPDASRELWELERDFGARVKLLQLDVTDERQTEEALRSLAGEPLDLLINNAGILPKDAPFPSVMDGDMRQGFEVNVLGPMRLTRRLLPNLQSASQPVVASITSKMGSLADNRSGRYYAYRTSKAALNMVMRSFALDYPDILSVVLHPGWVQTDMGGSGATLTVADSVAGICQVLTGLNKEMSGRFYDYQGNELPW